MAVRYIDGYLQVAVVQRNPIREPRPQLTVVIAFYQHRVVLAED